MCTEKEIFFNQKIIKKTTGNNDDKATWYTTLVHNVEHILFHFLNFTMKA